MLDTTSPTAVLGLIFGGVLSLLYGVRLITDAMQGEAGTRLRRSLTLLTRYPPVAFGVGIGITLLTQSSGATSSLLVGLVSVGLLKLPVAIITLLGTDVGAALTVQLLIFHITSYAFVFIGFGAAVAMLTRHGPRQGLGQMCFGFGLIISGLAALEAGSRPLAASHTTLLVFDALVKSPLVLALIGMTITMAFASSLASIGLVIVLASAGALPLSAALALMLGANVGSTVTAMLTALSHGSVAGRRLAFIHTGTKLTVAIGALLVLGPLTALLSRLALPVGTLVALSHLGFNLILVALFIPLSRPLAGLVEKLIPEQGSEEMAGSHYLNTDALAMPAVALGQAMREILHMTDLVTEMLNLSIHAFEERGTDAVSRIKALDDQLDDLNDAVKHYLAQLDEEHLSGEQKNRQLALFYIITDLEEMGDLLDKQWMRLARRKQRRQIAFSDQGWQELMGYYQEVTEAVQQAFAALAAQDPALAAEFFARKTQLGHMKRTLSMQHLRRLQSGVLPSVESSAIHLDLLNAMRALLSHASTIAHVVQENLSVREVGEDETYRLRL